MSEIISLFGPDGAGKSTKAKGLEFSNPNNLVVLRGTNLSAWEEFCAKTFNFSTGEIPDDDNFRGKVDFIKNVMAMVLGQTLDMDVVIEGNAIHKTIINTRAGLSTVEDISPDATIDEVINSLNVREALTATKHGALIFREVNIENAKILDERIRNRPDGRSKYDPRSVKESLAQLRATAELVDWLGTYSAGVVELNPTDRKPLTRSVFDT